MRKRIVRMTVSDCFQGKVKIIKRSRKSLLVEIVDVNMCYPCQRQHQPGELVAILRECIIQKTKPRYIKPDASLPW